MAAESLTSIPDQLGRMQGNWFDGAAIPMHGQGKMNRDPGA